MKKSVGFSIDAKVASEFEKYCDINSINRSQLMEKIIRKFLEVAK